jgi:hypothetical protein
MIVVSPTASSRSFSPVLTVAEPAGSSVRSTGTESQERRGRRGRLRRVRAAAEAPRRDQRFVIVIGRRDQRSMPFHHSTVPTDSWWIRVR